MEDGLGGGAVEGFEAALGVGEGQAHDHARDPVEAAAEELAVERLVDGLAAAVEPAGADGDVGAVVDGGEEALGFFDGRGEVGVGEHDDIAGGLEDAVADAVALAAVAGVLEEAEVGVCGHQRWTMAAVLSEEPSSTTRTSAFQLRSATQARTRSSACSMRALSLYAGMTMLRLGEFTCVRVRHASAETTTQRAEFMIRHFYEGDQELKTPRVVAIRETARAGAATLGGMASTARPPYRRIRSTPYSPSGGHASAGTVLDAPYGLSLWDIHRRGGQGGSGRQSSRRSSRWW